MIDLANRPYCTHSGSRNPSFCAITCSCSCEVDLPTYREAMSSAVAPARRGTRKKIANVTTLTTNSSSTAASSRRMMYLITVFGRGGRRGTPAGHRWPSPSSWSDQPLLLDAHPGVVVEPAPPVVDVDVGKRRRPVDQRLGPQARKRLGVLHHLLVDLAPAVVAGVRLGRDQRLVNERVDVRDLDAQVGVATTGPDRPAVDDLLQEAEAVRPVGAPPVDDDAELVVLGEVRLAGVQLGVVTRRERLEGQVDADLAQRLLERLGGGLLLWALRAGGDVDREAVGLAAVRQVLLCGVHVTVGLAGEVVQVDLLPARDLLRQPVGGEVATGRPAVRPTA